ncbi:hypothetical protein ACFSUK_23240 [Sphingobium scionense]
MEIFFAYTIALAATSIFVVRYGGSTGRWSIAGVWVGFILAQTAVLTILGGGINPHDPGDRMRIAAVQDHHIDAEQSALADHRRRVPVERHGGAGRGDRVASLSDQILLRHVDDMGGAGTGRDGHGHADGPETCVSGLSKGNMMRKWPSPSLDPSSSGVSLAASILVRLMEDR